MKGVGRQIGCSRMRRVIGGENFDQGELRSVRERVEGG